MRNRFVELVLPLAVLVGCQAAPSEQAQALVEVDRFDAGLSTEGRPIEVLTVGSGPEVVLMIASIHGTEPAGTALLERLAAKLVAVPDLVENRRVVLVPRANPDGLARRRRANAIGVDLNRDFPARNSKTRHDRQPETRALVELIDSLRPARIVSIHQPLACIDWDGPAADLARAMGSDGALAVRRLGTRPGSLGAWAGMDRGIPVITLELPGGAERLSDDALWQGYGALLLEAVRYRTRR